jgi:hypothetical protein
MFVFLVVTLLHPLVRPRLWRYWVRASSSLKKKDACLADHLILRISSKDLRAMTLVQRTEAARVSRFCFCREQAVVAQSGVGDGGV